MAIALGWIVLAGVLFAMLAFAFGLVRHYSDAGESSKLSKAAVVLALFVQLLTVLLLPLDVFSVASGTDAATGTQIDADATAANAHGVKILYFIFYSAVGLFGFVLLPFAFFFYEEDEDDLSLGERVCAALKYTLGFILTLVALVVVGIFLRSDAGAASGANSWINVLAGSYATADRVAVFFIGCLSAFGSLFMVFYTGYGMAYLPMSMIRGGSSSSGSGAGGRGDSPYDAYTPINDNARNARSASTNGRGKRNSNANSSSSAAEPLSGGVDGELRAAQRKNQERLNFLTSRYALSKDTEWTTSDRLQLHELKREEKRLASLLDVQRASFSRSLNAAAAETTCGGRILACCSGCASVLCDAVGWVRTLIGCVLLLVSLVLVGSLAVTATDRLMHSSCKTSCGYAIAAPSVFNPANELLVYASKIFPADYIVFAGIALYVFLCTIAAFCALGIRLVCVTYSVRRGRTAHNALVLLAFVLIFVTMALSVQFQTLAPQYAAFGEQFYLASVPAIAPTVAPVNLTAAHAIARAHTDSQLLAAAANATLVKTACSFDQINNGTSMCVLTQTVRFTNQLTTAMPAFGLIFYFATWGFLGWFLLCLLRLCACKPSDDDYAERDDEDVESNL